MKGRHAGASTSTHGHSILMNNGKGSTLLAGAEARASGLPNHHDARHKDTAVKIILSHSQMLIRHSFCIGR